MTIYRHKDSQWWMLLAYIMLQCNVPSRKSCENTTTIKTFWKKEKESGYCL